MCPSCGFTGSPQVTGLGPRSRAYKSWIVTPGVHAAQVEGWRLRRGEPQSGVEDLTGVPSALSGQNLLGDCGSSVCLGQFCWSNFFGSVINSCLKKEVIQCKAAYWTPKRDNKSKVRWTDGVVERCVCV